MFGGSLPAGMVRVSGCADDVICGPAFLLGSRVVTSLLLRVCPVGKENCNNDVGGGGIQG